MNEPGSDQPLGIMLYGYSEVDSIIIRDTISAGAGANVDLLSAHGCEEESVGAILDTNGSGSYADRDTKILMFLGFDDDHLGKAMDDLKSAAGIKRPIFCCLTEENVKWKLRDLMKDLIDEDIYWKRRNAAPPADAP